MADKKKRGLGRGLSALMGDVETAEAPRRADMQVPVEKIRPNPDQPRRTFDGSALGELAESIRIKGIIQPLIVREKPTGSGNYEIVAGERRWRAAQMAQLHEVPVVIREFNDTEVLEIAIIENIQRADLNPVEEALGYRQLMDRFGHTQEKLGEALGKSRSHITNLLRLLTLPDEVQTYLKEGKLTMGHARALVVMDDSVALARRVVNEGLSVREVEKLAKEGRAPKKSEASKQSAGSSKGADTKALEGELSANLGMKVEIDHKEGEENGTVTIRFKSLEELDDLCRILTAG